MEIGYVTLAAADEYFSTRIHSEAWGDATNATKTKALTTAHVLLDSQIKWKGAPTTPGQPNAWPRSGVEGIDPDAVPNSVKLAQTELSMVLLKTDTTALPDTAGFKSIQVDKIKLDVDGSTRGGVIPDVILSIIAHLGSLKSHAASSFGVSR